MAWYHWIAVYCIIIGATLFTIISPKPLWLWGVIALLVIIGVLLGLLLPHKEDKYANKEELISALLLFWGGIEMKSFISGFDITTVVGNVWYVALGFIFFDVVTGLLAAGAERKINSSINFIGIIRKVGLFVALAFLVFMDAYVNAKGYLIKLGVGLIVAYEGMSIIENFSRIGIDIKFLTKYFDKNKIGKGDQ
jgi:toxin secretion/phage lysis holin